MSQHWRQAIDQAIDGCFDRMVEVRRRMHMSPEPSGYERETTLYIYQLMDELGLRSRMGGDGRGVIVDLSDSSETASPPAPIFALRADIDALRIHDAKDTPYCSQHEGLMHACGHDGHTAALFGALHALHALSRAGALPCPITVRGIFQPAEETCQGAREMIGVGAMEGVGAIVALHLDPSRQTGKIGVREGVLTANCDEVELRIIGSGGHAARPHEARDPIAAAAQLINGIYLFIPRVTDSQEAVVVTVGQLIGGDNANVIPEEVILRGTIRTLNREVRRATCEHIERLARGIAETTDTQIEVHYGVGAPSVICDPEVNQMVEEAAREVVGDGVELIARPSMGSEDFAFYLERTPGAMFRLGCAADPREAPSLHSPLFDFDEEALRIGARVLARTAVLWSTQHRPHAMEQASPAPLPSS